MRKADEAHGRTAHPSSNGCYIRYPDSQLRNGNLANIEYPAAQRKRVGFDSYIVVQEELHAASGVINAVGNIPPEHYCDCDVTAPCGKNLAVNAVDRYGIA